MRKLSLAANWFLRLFLLIISFTAIMGFIFLFRPEYFLDDIESFIEYKLQDSTRGILHIGTINGNFVTGFKVNDVNFYQDSTIIFSAKNIYIDPDLSRIIFGKIVLSKVIINSMYYKYERTESYGDRYKYNLPNSAFNAEISSLIIDKGLIVASDKLYNLNGELWINIRDGVEIDIKSLEIDSPTFQDRLLLASGNLLLNESELEITNLISNSTWLSGKANGIIHIDNIHKSSGSIQIERLFLQAKDYAPISIFNLDADIGNDKNILSILLTCDVNYLNNKMTEIMISGIYSDENVQINSASLILNGQHITSTGIINIIENSWELNTNLENYRLSNKSHISGMINIKSDHLLENINGDISFVDSFIDSIKISSINGKFEFNDAVLKSDNILIKSYGQVGNIKIHSLTDTDNFNISGKVKINSYSDNSILSKYDIDSLVGVIDFTYIKNRESNNIYADVNFSRGTLLKNKFTKFRGEIYGEIINGELVGNYSGILNGWHYNSYNWDSLYFKVDYSNMNISYFDFIAKSAMGDKINIFAEKDSSGDIFVNQFTGSLKQTKLNIQPFYIIKRIDYFHIPEINFSLGNSKMIFKGNYQGINHYDISGNIQNLELSNLYSITGKSYRINGFLKSAIIKIENDNSQLNPNPIIFAAIELRNGTIDDIQFNEIGISGSYRNRRLLLSNFSLETELGNINGDGWINIGFLNTGSLLLDEDEMKLNLTIDNVKIDRFNRYLPWGYETRGFMTGSIDINGTVSKPEIISHMEISQPGFDKINGEKLSGNIFLKDNKLDFRNLLLKTKYGRYSGFGFLPLDLNLIIENRADISHELIDFVFTGNTNNVEFLPPYFDMLDSLSTYQSDDISLSSYSIELLLTGTLANPIRNGKIVIQNGILYLDPINEPIRDITGILSISNNQLIINKMTGMLDNEDNNSILDIPIISEIKNLFWSDNLVKQNNLIVSGSMDLTEIFNPKFALNLRGNDISISSSYDLFHGSGTANINLTGRDTMYISGDFIPTPYNFTITSLGDDPSYEESNLSSSKIISYNIHVPIKDGIKVETENISLLFDGDISITKVGNQNYNFSGKANIIDGNFFDNRGNVFQNTYGNILLTPVDNTPYIDLHAQTEIEENIIDVSFIGFTDNPTLIFNSQDYTQTEILKILTFGNVDGFADPNQAGNLLSNYLENEIEKNITKYSTLDEFQLTSRGSLLENIERNEDIQLKLILGKQLSNKIYLNTEFDLNDIEHSQYEATYRINHNTSIVGGLDENNLWHLSYRIKFYYK